MHPTPAVTRPRGFTLVELAGVMIVLAVISFTAIPALSGMDRAGAAADRDAVETLAVLARQRAWATGRPHALRLGDNGSLASVVWLESFGGEPQVIRSSSGNSAGDERTLGNDSVTALVGVEAAGDGVLEVWFNGAGEPLVSEPVDDSGTSASETVEIRFESGATLSVLTRSGVLRW